MLIVNNAVLYTYNVVKRIDLMLSVLIKVKKNTHHCGSTYVCDCVDSGDVC